MTALDTARLREIVEPLLARIGEMGDMHIPVSADECDALFAAIGWEVRHEAREIDASALEAILKLLAALVAAEAERATAYADGLERAAGICHDLFDACIHSDVEAFAYQIAEINIRAASTDASGEGKGS